MQRLLIRLVEGVGERGHETPPGGTAAKLGEIDDAGECLAGDQPAQGRAHLGGDRHVGVTTAEYDDRIAGSGAVGAGTQAPPHAKRIDNCDAGTALKQPFDKALGCVGLARSRGADDSDPVVERIGRKD